MRERKYDVSIAKTTAIASGTKSDFAAPAMNDTGTKTMQMQSVETSAGAAISWRAVEDRLHDRLAHGALAVEVLDLDRRVVDEDADGERHPAERHEVERLAESIEHDDRDEQRERDRDQDDDRAAPAPQKEQHHQAGEAGGDGGLADDAVDRRRARRPIGRREA